jgi:hypothetical protein
LALFAGLVVAAVAAIALVFLPNADKLFGSKKAWELTTQFLFVGVLGAGVALIYREWEKARADEAQRLERRRTEDVQRFEKEKEERALYRDLLVQFYRAMVDLYHDCKKIRRTIRAWSDRRQGEPWQIECERYERLMDQLEDVQLRAEGMVRQVRAQRHLFGGSQHRLEESLRRIEKYLNKLLKDYEQSYATRRAKQKDDLIALDDALMEFVTPRKGNRETPVSREFFFQADAARRLVLGLIGTRASAGPFRRGFYRRASNGRWRRR